ncbi:MAG: LysR family transcriptional regulator [Gammaproteobacteria bacterium]
MDKLACMRAFVAVVDADGFSSAARKVGMTKALLSKYVAQLEQSLATRLLQRTTRHVSPTEIGRAYYERCIPLLEELDELESSVRDIHASPRGELRISAPVSFAELHLMSLVSAFTQQYPDICIDLRLSDRVVDIVEEGIDLAIRIGNLPDSSLVARSLGEIQTIAYASPEYLQENGVPQQPDDLLQHACVIDTNIADGRRWRFKHNGRETTVPVQGNHAVNSAIAVRELVLAGKGIAIGPRFVIADDLKAGRLNSVLGEYEIQTFGLYAVYSHRRHLSTKVRLFIDCLIAHFSSVVE